MDNTDKFDNNIVNNTSILDFVKINGESKNNQRDNEIKFVKQTEKMLNSSVDDDEDHVVDQIVRLHRQIGHR